MSMGEEEKRRRKRRKISGEGKHIFGGGGGKEGKYFEKENIFFGYQDGKRKRDPIAKIMRKVL